MSTFSYNKITDCPKAVIVSFSKFSWLFPRFIESFESKSGILLGTMSTFILAHVVPIIIGMVAAVIAVTSAPSPNRHWLLLLINTTPSISWLLRLRNEKEKLLGDCNLFGKGQFHCNMCCCLYCYLGSLEPSDLGIHILSIW